MGEQRQYARAIQNSQENVRSVNKIWRGKKKVVT
jgi:hypothetical protein